MAGIILVTISIIFSLLEIRKIVRIKYLARKKQYKKTTEESNSIKEKIKEHNYEYEIERIETINYIKAKLSKKEYKGYLKGNIIKYLSKRNYKEKEKIDLKKALWYLEKLIDCM